ncbi:hypothetical protein B0A48_18839 [Cryoendolithus antarcticus]|uniref:Protein kinase domain-containing protein n=1 Tax=Cryoendolithus antarcticus TaxID=1507870 RepID=A0A1V8S826_9PEZI|nr:hypothetical protein B0A48_18839 [Cryoendolithus antarcticus]
MLNYYANGSYKLKLIDFSNASMVDDPRTVRGTLGYLPPEEVFDKNANHIYSDMFALALTILQIMNEGPFLPESLIKAYETEQTDTLCDERKFFAKVYHLVILSCLIARKQNRVQGHKVRTGVLKYFNNAEEEIAAMLVRRVTTYRFRIQAYTSCFFPKTTPGGQRITPVGTEYVTAPMGRTKI